MRYLKIPFLTAAATFAVLAGTVSPVFAHSLTVSANGVCEAGKLRIAYTVTSFSTDSGGSHNNVDVLFNSVEVDNFAFTIPNVYRNIKDAPAGAAPGDTVTVTAWARDGAWGPNGSQVEATHSISVVLPSDRCGRVTPGVGRFTGGGHAIDANNVKITRGFTLHCDLILSNNLEINWPGTGRQNQFHMLVHTSAICTDDPTIDQRPPNAPVDTIVGVGTGRYNGLPGYTVNFTLVDAGEPGTADQIALVITAPGGGVVLNLPIQNITGGNIQAHYDQPHK